MPLEFSPAEFGKKVESLRKQAGLNQGDLAQQVGVHRGYISQLENAQADNPTVQVIWALAKALKTTPAYMLGIDENPGQILDEIEDLDEDVQKIVELSLGLRPSERRAVISMIRALLVSREEEQEELARDLRVQAELLRSIYELGGEAALQQFFNLVGFDYRGDVTVARMKLGITD